MMGRYVVTSMKSCALDSRIAEKPFRATNPPNVRDIPRSFRSPDPQTALSTACDLLFSNLSTRARYGVIVGNRDCFSAPFAVREHQANRTVPHRSEGMLENSIHSRQWPL